MHICHMNNSEHVENRTPAIIEHCQLLYIFVWGISKKDTVPAGISMDFPPFGAEILPMTSENLKINASHVDVDPGSWNTSWRAEHSFEMILFQNDSLVCLFVCLFVWVCLFVIPLTCVALGVSFFHVHLLQCARVGKFSWVFSFLAMDANWCLWFLWVGVDHAVFFNTWHLFHKGYQTHTLGAAPPKCPKCWKQQPQVWLSWWPLIGPHRCVEIFYRK